MTARAAHRKMALPYRNKAGHRFITIITVRTNANLEQYETNQAFHAFVEAPMRHFSLRLSSLKLDLPRRLTFLYVVEWFFSICMSNNYYYKRTVLQEISGSCYFV